MQDLGVITAEGKDWIYYGIEDSCWAMRKRDGVINKLRYSWRNWMPHKEWRGTKFSTLPAEIQREYLLWKMSR